MFKRDLDVSTSPREHALDFLELKLELTFVEKEGLVRGKVTHIFTPLRTKVDQFSLDTKGDLTIKEAMLNGNKIEFRKDSTGYLFFTPNLSFGNKYTLSLSYEAHPKKGLYFIGWNDTTNISRKQIWSQGQAIDNRNWIPMYDEMNDKVISEVNVTFNAAYKVLSNGAKLVEKENGDGTKTWKYKMDKPHAPYLIMLGIGKYDIKELKSKSGVPIRLYYYPEHKDRVDITYKYMTQMFDFLEKETGVPYPWKPTYSQIPVQDYTFGAMENTSAVIFGDFYFVDSRAYLDRNYVGVNAHELTHMWFGDLITARSESDTWLQESFATHYQWLFDKEAFGKEQFDWNRRLANNEALAASLIDKKAIASTNGGRVRWYPKGAFVIEMMKYMVGREQYNRVIKYYLEKNAYKNVDANELLIAFQDVLGVSLNNFWEQWVYKGGEPSYKVSWTDIRNAKNERSTEISIEQTQEVNDLVGLFKMPIKIEVWYKDGSRDTIQPTIENQFHRISIPNKSNFDIDFVLFDPNSQILKSVSFVKYQEEYFKQALKAPNMLDRYDAIVAMKNVEIDKKRDVLTSVYIKERFHGIKSEIISQLVNDTAKSSVDLVKSAISSKDANVRRSVLTNMNLISAEWEPELRKLLSDSSYANVELALEKLSFKFPANTQSYLDITKSEKGNSGNNIRIKWLELACGLDKPKYINELVAFACPPYEFRTRINAMEALKKLNYLDEKLLIGLLSSASHFNTRLSAPAEQNIQHYFKQSAYRKLITDYSQKIEISAQEKQTLKRNMK
ncbi:MAG: M1 family metallopeptidase [Cytophagales bacterium]